MSARKRGKILTGRRKAATIPMNKFTISGGNDERVPPVPIPNTEVKPLSADGTWLETARESRSLPDPNIPLRANLEGIFCAQGRAKHALGAAGAVHAA